MVLQRYRKAHEQPPFNSRAQKRQSDEKMKADKEYLYKDDLRRARRSLIKEEGRQALSKALEEAWKDLKKSVSCPHGPTQKK